MLSRYLARTLLLLFWLLAGVVYVWAGWQQKEHVNLSAAAGGQYPYLKYADGVAKSGVTRFFGDRNRMPLYPTLLAVVHDDDWKTFVDRSAWFAIASSVVVLIGIGCLCHATLPMWPATVLTLAAAVCVFMRNASFVQAELTFYGLLFASWLVLGRLISRPRLGWAVTAGVAVALTYLTKSSGLAILAAFLPAICVRAVALALSQRGTEAHEPANGSRTRPASVLVCGAVVVVVFLALVYPYIANNKERFGRYFYNVNTTFFMWCDSWSEAKSFADTYNISEQYPDAPVDQIPSPANYWRTHGPRLAYLRLANGFVALWSRASEGAVFKYFAISVVFLVVLIASQREQAKQLLARYWAVVLFWLLFFGGYMVAFAWYSQVAFGDRFLLSLFLPAMFAVWWLNDRLASGAKPFPLFGRRVRLSNAVAACMVVGLIAEGLATARTKIYEPGAPFIQSYYNECRELQKAGNLDEAVAGFMGVIQLDPEFAPAHHELGMVAMRTARIDGAISSFQVAVHLNPQDANMRNSLGSALVRAKRVKEAIVQFERATELDPRFAMAWYNLGGSYYLAGELEKAQAVRATLDKIAPDLARQLSELIDK